MSNPDTFRAEARQWLEDNCPPSMRTPMPAGEYVGGGRRGRFPSDDARLWMQRMGARGWTAPTWPVEYGGGGLDRERHLVLVDEMRRINARPPLAGMGLTMIGPALLEYGTPEQKAEHLPKIVRGDIWWCQGYSEPGAGSDLASLQTRAVSDGDEYVITGQKIWTSGADNADWIFCLVRTDPDAPQHEGITFILFDMDQPGVTVKPIRLISGASPFCEVFFDGARALKKNVVGGVNRGWTVAKRLLQYERTSIGGIGGGLQRQTTLEEHAIERIGLANGRLRDEALRERIARHRMDDRIFALTARRIAEEGKAGIAPGAISSMLKYYGTEQNKRRHEILLSVLGTQSLGWDGDGYTADELALTRQWLRSKANSIEGGTSEVQLNILAKRELGLPD